MIRKRSRVWVAATAAVLGGLMLMRVGFEARRSKAELLAFYEQIQPGFRAVDLELVFQTNNFAQLKLWRTGPDKLIVQTPIEWGAVNWVLIIESNGAEVSAVRIRSQDSHSIRPNGAPPDKVSKSSKS